MVSHFGKFACIPIQQSGIQDFVTLMHTRDICKGLYTIMTDIQIRTESIHFKHSMTGLPGMHDIMFRWPKFERQVASTHLKLFSI